LPPGQRAGASGVVNSAAFFLQETIMKMRSIVLLVAAIAVLIPATVLAADDAEAGKGTDIPIGQRWSGGYCGIRQADELIIQDADAWETLWSRVHSTRFPKPEPPAIDFQKQTVLAVFMGTRNTGGYGIRIESVVDTGEETIARVKQRFPPPGAMVTMALTQPYDIVTIAKQDQPVKFEQIKPKFPANPGARPFPIKPFPGRPIPGRPIPGVAAPVPL